MSSALAWQSTKAFNPFTLKFIAALPLIMGVEPRNGHSQPETGNEAQEEEQDSRLL
ncbi:hypothetical protein LC607_19320 [Nostoc sp. CHAB 5824]|nr:hypothetical protein [Nostoc sp. CHAB 5824]